MSYLLIYRGSRVSGSARVLRRALPNCRINTLGNNVVRRRAGVVLNWGSTDTLNLLPRRGYLTVLNGQQAVADAVHKTVCLARLAVAGVRVPRFWTDISQVDRSGIVIARTVLNGHSGEGIVVVRPDDVLVPAPLYVKYIPKTQEFRVHVFNGRVIFIQEKRKRQGFEQDANQKLLRNHDNGWNFISNDINYANENSKQELEAEAIKAVSACGLDFGAVDLVIGREDGLPYVLEINTAPSLTGESTLNAYVGAITNYVRESASG